GAVAVLLRQGGDVFLLDQAVLPGAGRGGGRRVVGGVGGLLRERHEVGQVLVGVPGAVQVVAQALQQFEQHFVVHRADFGGAVVGGDDAGGAVVVHVDHVHQHGLPALVVRVLLRQV